MTATTVLLADLPPMLEDIVRYLLRSRADLQVVRGSAKDIGLAAAAAAAAARLVVVSCPDAADLHAVDERLAQAANLSVFALNKDGASGCLHALQHEATQYDDLSGAQLTAALDGATPRGLM